MWIDREEYLIGIHKQTNRDYWRLRSMTYYCIGKCSRAYFMPDPYIFFLEHDFTCISLRREKGSQYYNEEKPKQHPRRDARKREREDKKDRRRRHPQRTTNADYSLRECATMTSKALNPADTHSCPSSTIDRTTSRALERRPSKVLRLRSF
jgi:hypothetical protein